MRKFLPLLLMLCSAPALAAKPAKPVVPPAPPAAEAQTISSTPADAAPEVPLDADYAHFYRVACVPPLKYFAITREDYRGEAVELAKKPDARAALAPFGLYATTGFGTCRLGAQEIAWNVSGDNFQTHIALNGVTLVDGVAILPDVDAELPMVAGFELVLDIGNAVHELAVHGVWKERSPEDKKEIGLVLNAERAARWFPRCDAEKAEACASYHFIQFPAAQAPVVQKAPERLPEKSRKTGIMPGRPSSNLHTSEGAKPLE